MAKRIRVAAYAVVTRRIDGPDIIDLNRIEEHSDKGRRTLIRQINRPAGERVEAVEIIVRR